MISQFVVWLYIWCFISVFWTFFLRFKSLACKRRSHLSCCLSCRHCIIKCNSCDFRTLRSGWIFRWTPLILLRREISPQWSTSTEQFISCLCLYLWDYFCTLASNRTRFVSFRIWMEWVLSLVLLSSCLLLFDWATKLFIFVFDKLLNVFFSLSTIFTISLLLIRSQTECFCFDPFQ